MMKSSGAFRLMLQSSSVSSTSSSCHFHRCTSGRASSVSNSLFNAQQHQPSCCWLLPQSPSYNTGINRSSSKGAVSLTIVRRYGSKTPIPKSSLAASQKVSPDSYTSPFEIQSSKDGIYLESLSSSRSSNIQSEGSPEESSLTVPRRRRRKEILRLDESEYKDYAILQQKPPLLDRRGEAQSHYFRAFAPEKRNNADVLSVLHGDLDLRTAAVKRWWASVEAEHEVRQQLYNPKRNSVLGNDLAAAHFIVFRKGRVRFRGHEEWVSNYRKDAKPGAAEEDLPVMKFDLCTLPVNFDPRYRLEAIDCAGLALRYEGLLNFQNLSFVKWLSFKDAPLIDDWCLDRIARIFYEKLEYIDLSGCTRVTDKGIGTLHRCKNLKTLIVENMSHVKNLEIVCALLEDHLPELTVNGIDYAAKTEQLRIEGEELERKAKEEAAALEANTITVEPKTEPEPVDPFKSTDERRRVKNS